MFWFMLLTMKYVLIFAAIVFLIRIDFFLRLFDQASDYSSKEETIEINDRDLNSSKDIIPISKDQSLNYTSKDRVFALMEEFKSNPEAEARQKIVAAIKGNPKDFGQGQDIDFESRLFAYRDLLFQKNSELLKLLVELQNATLGENKKTVQRFFSLLIDSSMETFLHYYSQTSDVSCMIMSVAGNPVPAYEEVDFFQARDEALARVLVAESSTPAVKQLASNCQVMVRDHLSKITPPEAPVTNEAPEEEQ
jgi:hypothetical protein